MVALSENPCVFVFHCPLPVIITSYSLSISSLGSGTVSPADIILGTNNWCATINQRPPPTLQIFPDLPRLHLKVVLPVVTLILQNEQFLLPSCRAMHEKKRQDDNYSADHCTVNHSNTHITAVVSTPRRPCLSVILPP